MGLDGCPLDHRDHWREQLRYFQLSALLRCGALAAAIQAVRLQFRDRQRGVGAALILVMLAALILLRPISALEESAGLVLATAPGMLALLTTVVLAVVASFRRHRVLTLSTLLMLAPTVDAVDNLALTYRQTALTPFVRGPGPAVFISSEWVETWSLLNVAIPPATVAAPILFVWAFLRPSAHPTR